MLTSVRSWQKCAALSTTSTLRQPYKARPFLTSSTFGRTKADWHKMRYLPRCTVLLCLHQPGHSSRRPQQRYCSIRLSTW
eukprot:6473664-Amphidinium_carterae.3